MVRSSKQESANKAQAASETRPHEAQQALSHGGQRYHQGETVNMTDDEASAFGSNFVKPADAGFKSPKNRAITDHDTR